MKKKTIDYPTLIINFSFYKSIFIDINGKSYKLNKNKLEKLVKELSK